MQSFLQPLKGQSIYQLRIKERCQSGRPDSYREGQFEINPKKKGEMPEWSIGAVSKTVDLARGPRVRIPISPQPISKINPPSGGFFDTIKSKSNSFEFALYCIKKKNHFWHQVQKMVDF